MRQGHESTSLLATCTLPKPKVAIPTASTTSSFYPHVYRAAFLDRRTMPASGDLTVQYSSSNSAQSFSHRLPILDTSPSPDQRTSYFSALSVSAKAMQKEINDYLTRKMEEDKAATAAKSDASNEEKEEANYGEEMDE